MSIQEKQSETAASGPEQRRAPFQITRTEERRLRARAEQVAPALMVDQATSFDDYVRQLMIPPAVMDLARKAASIRLSAWEVQAIRAQLDPAARPRRLLREILEKKRVEDPTHPPYIRVACTGKGSFDEDAKKHGYAESEVDHKGDYGSPVVLEIWPAQHFSPIHSHGGTTGIIYCLAGQLDVMSYGALKWDAEKLGLTTLTPGQCAWLTGKQNAVHKVFCPMDGGEVREPSLMNNTGDFAASFHVYLNQGEPSPDAYQGVDFDRNEFDYVEEGTNELKTFKTYSDLSWRALRMVLAKTALT